MSTIPGLFVALISVLIYFLFSKRYVTSPSVERYMFVTTFILFLIAFIVSTFRWLMKGMINKNYQDWVVDLYRTLEAFKHFSASDGSRTNFLRRTTEPSFILLVLTFDLQNMIGEIFMVNQFIPCRAVFCFWPAFNQQICRVYIVWGRNKWIILPLIILCGAAFGVCHIASLFLFEYIPSQLQIWLP